MASGMDPVVDQLIESANLYQQHVSSRKSTGRLFSFKRERSDSLQGAQEVLKQALTNISVALQQGSLKDADINEVEITLQNLQKTLPRDTQKGIKQEVLRVKAAIEALKENPLDSMGAGNITTGRTLTSARQSDASLQLFDPLAVPDSRQAPEKVMKKLSPSQIASRVEVISRDIEENYGAMTTVAINTYKMELALLKESLREIQEALEDTLNGTSKEILELRKHKNSDDVVEDIKTINKQIAHLKEQLETTTSPYQSEIDTIQQTITAKLAEITQKKKSISFLASKFHTKKSQQIGAEVQLLEEQINDLEKQILKLQMIMEEESSDIRASINRLQNFLTYCIKHEPDLTDLLESHAIIIRQLDGLREIENSIKKIELRLQEKKFNETCESPPDGLESGRYIDSYVESLLVNPEAHMRDTVDYSVTVDVGGASETVVITPTKQANRDIMGSSYTITEKKTKDDEEEIWEQKQIVTAEGLQKSEEAHISRFGGEKTSFTRIVQELRNRGVDESEINGVLKFMVQTVAKDSAEPVYLDIFPRYELGTVRPEDRSVSYNMIIDNGHIIGVEAITITEMKPTDPSSDQTSDFYESKTQILFRQTGSGVDFTRGDAIVTVCKIDQP